MLEVIVISVIFILIWVLTVQLIKKSFEDDDEFIKLHTYDVDVEVINYTPYKKFGKLLAYVNNEEHEFIDNYLLHKHILENNIGKYVSIRFLSRVEGLFLFSTVLYVCEVSEYRFQHFSKW